MAKPSIDQLCELHSQIKSGRVLDEDMQAFLENPKLWRNGQQKTNEESSQPKLPEPTITPYSITIRHSETFAQRIKRLACSWLHPWITDKNTPVAVDKKKGDEDKEVFTVHFNRPIESDDAVAALAALDPPLKPAIHEGLIAFGADHLDVQKKFPVVQLGSSWEHPDDGRVVSCLLRRDSDRDLSLYFWRYEWNACCRFLAVRA